VSLRFLFHQLKVRCRSWRITGNLEVKCYNEALVKSRVQILRNTPRRYKTAMTSQHRKT
jgi:hypothetical protein